MNLTQYKAGSAVSDFIGSFLAAFCVHALLVVLLIFAPTPPPVQVDLGLPTINLTQYVLPGEAPGKAEEGPKDEPAPLPEAQKPDETPAPVAPETTPEPEVAPAPVETVPVIPTPIPPIPTEPTPASTPEPEVAPKAETKPEPTLSDAEILRRAMAEATQAAVSTPAPKPRTSADILAEAMAANRSDAARHGGTGGSGGGDGSYISGTYRESVISFIQPRITTRPRADGKVYEMTVLLEIADDGTIVKMTVTRPSGDSAFESHVLRAIRETGKVLPPPRKDLKKVEIVFTSLMSGA